MTSSRAPAVTAGRGAEGVCDGAGAAAGVDVGAAAGAAFAPPFSIAAPGSSRRNCARSSTSARELCRKCWSSLIETRPRYHATRAWLARRIVAEPPDAPPPNVPALKEDLNLTLRQRIEQHRNQPGCLQCHSKIDPWGIPFEEYDAGGMLKAQKVDASSKLPDKTEVDGIDGLRRYLANERLDQVAFSFAKNLTVYATGRSLTYNETNFLKQDVKKLRAGGYRMQDMIRYVAGSKIFLEK